MGNTAYILTKEDVPQYIQEIVKRLHIVMIDHIDDKGQNWWGYTFKLKAKWKLSYEHQLEADCEKLLKWCKRWNAHAELIKYMWWMLWNNSGTYKSYLQSCQKLQTTHPD